MRNWIAGFMAFALLLAGVPLAFADTVPGVAAYQSGDFKKALPLLEQEAAAGDPVAQTKLGLIHAKGQGVTRDPKVALLWFEKAAAQGEAEAEYCIGVVYDIGDGRPRDVPLALSWYRKAAEKNFAKAQFNLGHLLLTGDETERDFLAGRMWIQRAADLDYAEAKELAGRIADFLAEETAKSGLPVFAGGDGSSFETAISFPDITSNFKGVEAEYTLIRAFLPGWQKAGQGLIEHKGRIYDEIELRKDGAERSVYFDISNWFGKLD
jgi:TPR repeat protein